MKARRWIVVLLVLVGLVVAADRIGASVAENQIAKQFPCHTGKEASASINGLPFLNQALGGKYDDIEVNCTPFVFGSITDATLNTHLHGTHVSPADALSGLKQVPVDDLTAQLFVPYASLAKSSGVAGLAMHLQDGHIAVTAPISTPFVGTVNVTAVGDFTDPGDGVTLSLRDFKANGSETPQILDSLLASFTKIRMLQNAPYGIRIVSVVTTPTGVRFNGEANGVVLRRTTTS